MNDYAWKRAFLTHWHGVGWTLRNSIAYEHNKSERFSINIENDYPHIAEELYKGNPNPLELFCKLQGYELVNTRYNMKQEGLHAERPE